MPRISVLCGTGMSGLSSILKDIEGRQSEKLVLESPWGLVPIEVVSGESDQVFVIDRHHSKGSERTPPHRIEHRANVYAAISCNPDAILSINSVGSFSENLPPGTVGVASDVLDLSTKPWSFYDDEAIHSDRTCPFDQDIISVCKEQLEETQGVAPSTLVVAQCTGPQFETPSEINALEKLGAHVVGMTLGPEQRLVSEYEIPHVSLVCSSNWAAGRTPGDPTAEIDHYAVDTIASKMRESLVACVISVLQSMQNNN
jgi:5'-methylthioadenosine phosphorylase